MTAPELSQRSNHSTLFEVSCSRCHRPCSTRGKHVIEIDTGCRFLLCEACLRDLERGRDRDWQRAADLSRWCGLITARELVGVLKAKKSGDGWIARCPVRDSHANGDRKPSLSIGERDGVLLLKCHVGCSFEKILAAIPHVNNGSRGRREIAHFNYRDETGKLLYQCVRFDPKQFLQRQPGNGGDWVWNLKGVRRVPYRLPELIAADPAETVFIAEGEGKCDALAARGLVATTGAGGALKWRDA